MKHEIHILIGCADARDFGQMHLDVVREFGAKYREEKGIIVEVFVLRVAGSFVTPDVVMDIKRTIEQIQRETSGKYERTDFFVHIQTHGHLDEDSNKNYISHIYEMNVVEGSVLNCGMLGATTVGIEIEQLLLKEKPEIHAHTGAFVVDSGATLQRLLRDVYAYDGYLAGDWIKGIDKLRTHPRLQKSKLEKAIAADSELKRLNIQITAGIQDYAIHGLIRLDGGEPHVAFWDDINLEIRRRSEAQLETLKHQSQKQTPFAGLLCMADPRRTSRTLAARAYFEYKNIPIPDTIAPNTLFNIAGSAFDLPEIPFGPYHIAGFYYAVRHLGLTDQIVMGYDQAQTQRIIRKMHNDPIMSLVLRKYNVHLISFNQQDYLF